jgi:F420-non-reducing hydrogenase small subunit
MPSKPRVAFYWCASCGGCEEAILDLHERILDVVGQVDIVFWPVALDFKRRDLEEMPDQSLAAAFVNGAVRTSEQEEMAHLMRRKAVLLFAFGSCAHLGGVPGLANLFTRASLLAAAYPETVPSDGLPALFERVKTLNQVVPVDYYLPGCPPTPSIILPAIEALLSGKLPEKGSVVAPDRALCEECPRKETRPVQLAITEFKRPHQVPIDETKCLLAQGLACLGPATRSGCEALCVRGNMPCTGCFGPTSRVRDFGGKALSALASIAAGNEDPAIMRALEHIPDPAGTFYRYSLPSGLLQPLPYGRGSVTEVSHV